MDRRPLLQRLVSAELDNLVLAGELVEEAIEKELGLLRVQAQQIAEEAASPNAALYLDHLADSYHRVDGELASIMRSAIMLRAYAALEHYLIAFCWLYAEGAGESLEAEKVGRWNVDQARRFLKRAGAPFPDQSRGWQELKRFVEIRNRFAHSGGRLGEAEVSGALGAYLNRHPDLGVEGVRIRVGANYVPAIIAELRTLFACFSPAPKVAGTAPN